MEIATKIAPLALAIIMFGLGLGLTLNDFLRVIKIPRDFIVGFICQVILLPIIAFILIKIIPMPLEIALGNDNCCSPRRSYFKCANKICKW